MITDSTQPDPELTYRPLPERWEELRQMSDLQYPNPALQEQSWLSALWGAIKRFLVDMLGWAPDRRLLEYGIYLICAIIVIWAILRLLGVDWHPAVKKKKQLSEVKFSQRQAEEVDPQAELQRALDNGQWRAVIRWQYELALRTLARNGMVDLARYKTARDYQYEIKHTGQRQAFGQLAQVFEYTWYGGFEAQLAARERARKAFEMLEKELPL